MRAVQVFSNYHDVSSESTRRDSMATRAASASLRAASYAPPRPRAFQTRRRLGRLGFTRLRPAALRALRPFRFGADTDASFSSLGDPAVLSSRLARRCRGLRRSAPPRAAPPSPRVRRSVSRTFDRLRSRIHLSQIFCFRSPVSRDAASRAPRRRPPRPRPSSAPTSLDSSPGSSSAPSASPHHLARTSKHMGSSRKLARGVPSRPRRVSACAKGTLHTGHRVFVPGDVNVAHLARHRA